MSSTQRCGGSGGLSISMLSSSGREEGEAGEWKWWTGRNMYVRGGGGSGGRENAGSRIQIHHAVLIL